MIRRRALVSGTVQGVGFRAAVTVEAHRIASLDGWVRNLPDGRVELVAQGPEHAVLELLAWCRKGPPSSRVSALEIFEEACEPALGLFRIER